MEQAVLTSSYLGPVSYYTVLSNFDSILIEQYDSYHKQTYRNRCRILGANGPLDLIIPVVKKSGEKVMMKDVRIDYSTNWQNIHWRSLFSAYNSSPFFEFFYDLFVPFYENRWDFLLDYNLELMNLVAEILQLKTAVHFTGKFTSYSEEVFDLRDLISPKRITQINNKPVEFVPYTQTFHEKFDFIPDLSIVDLLFNCGNTAEMIIRENKIQTI